MPALNLKKTYQKYPEYKDSGVDWLKKIPLGWNLLPVRAVLKERKEKNSKLEIDNILSVMKDVGVVRYADKGDVGNKSSDRPEAYKIVRSGDIVLNSMNLSIGSVGIAREEGVTSSVYIIYGPRQAVSTTDFYHYLFETTQFQRHLASYGKGIMELREAVREINIRNQIIIAPSLDTQKIISDFLDKKIKIIDQIIKKKQKLISLLQEKRSALITHAVTKGLNPKAKMKPSGIDWIGEIPENWSVEKIKSIASRPLKYGLNTSVEPDENKNQPRYIRITDINDDGTLNDVYKSLPLSISTGYLLKDGDILFARTGATAGKAILYKKEMGDACFAGYLIQLRMNKGKMIPNYLYLLTKSNFYETWKNSIFIQATIQNIGAQKYANLALPIPPLQIQEEITNFLISKNEKVDRAIKTVRTQIEKLVEYRSSLIYHSVTGKIKI